MREVIRSKMQRPAVYVPLLAALYVLGMLTGRECRGTAKDSPPPVAARDAEAAPVAPPDAGAPRGRDAGRYR